MKKIIITGPFDDKQKAEFASLNQDVDCLFMDKSDITFDLIAEAHALVGNIDTDLLKKQPQLEWVQLTSSGADKYAQESDIAKNAVLTTATGAYGIGIAEYMVAMLLSMMKRIPTYLENQKKGIWKDEGIVTTPYGKRVLIVGTGNIGTEFAKRMRGFGCTLVGVRRRTGECPEEFDEMYTMDQLKEQLAYADIIALCLPGTAETYHLFDKEVLSLCKKGAYLMNVGRGNVIPLDTFLDKEVSERFAGIWLDVCEVEPLPEKHPLFFVENVLITPHITGGFHLDLTMDNIFQIAYQNMKAWLGKGEYTSVLDRKTGYCK